MNNDQSNTPTQQGITPDIKPMLDEAYNKGIDDCLKYAEMGLDHCELVDDRSGTALMNELIRQLQQLKKQ